MMDNETLISRWQTLNEHIEKLQQQSLLGQPVTLIAVSKGHSANAIEVLLKQGQRVFGENRVQEAQDKWPELKKRYPDSELHLIGSLQTNKVKDALTLFDAIHTVDRAGLVEALVKSSCQLPVVSCQQFFVQVNTGEEPQKSGVIPAELPALMEYIKQPTGNGRRATLPVTGLMCVPPADANPAPHFALLHTLAKHYHLPNLSMGMSGDYETAIRLGATHVRIGTAIFGERG